MWAEKPFANAYICVYGQKCPITKIYRLSRFNTFRAHPEHTLRAHPENTQKSLRDHSEKKSERTGENTRGSTHYTCGAHQSPWTLTSIAIFELGDQTLLDSSSEFCLQMLEPIFASKGKICNKFAFCNSVQSVTKWRHHNLSLLVTQSLQPSHFLSFTPQLNKMLF